jgi:hypothetical protein
MTRPNPGYSEAGFPLRKLGCHTEVTMHTKNWPNHKRVKTVDQLFWDKVLITPGCWVWQGFITKKGYGFGYFDGRSGAAHRYSWELHNKNRACVNPSHLALLAHPEHIALDLTKTVCKRGHPLNPETTWVDKSGNRYCRECDKLRGKAKYIRYRDKILARQREYYKRKKGGKSS